MRRGGGGVVEEIACGRRPPENWKTRIARPTAMSDSLVMRLSFFLYLFLLVIPLTTAWVYILFLFPAFFVAFQPLQPATAI